MKLSVRLKEKKARQRTVCVDYALSFKKKDIVCMCAVCIFYTSISEKCYGKYIRNY